MTITGTSHFTSIGAAAAYYRDYFGEDGFKSAQRKLAEGEIYIGKPHLKPGEVLTTTDNGARYAIVSSR